MPAGRRAGRRGERLRHFRGNQRATLSSLLAALAAAHRLRTSGGHISSMPRNTLKAPFPWFGGKSRVASLVWERFGEVRNYVEPFAGSLAVLLGRPQPFAGPET